MAVIGGTQYITVTYTALSQFEADREEKLALGWVLVNFVLQGENVIAVYRQVQKVILLL